MDGNFRSRTTTVLARRAAGLVLAAAAFSAAPAYADPATDFAAGSAPVQAATDVAKSYWSTTPCGGNVSIVWMPLTDSTNATSTWSNPVGQYDAPEQNSNCQIAFNSSLTWDWTRFCSILVHEYGHLSGKPHSADAADVMYPYYEKPVDQCVAAAPTQPAVVPEIVQPSAVLPALKPEEAPATASTSSTGTATKPRAITSAHRVKHAILIVVREPKRHVTHRHHHLHHRHRLHRKHRAVRHHTVRHHKLLHHRRTTP